MIHQRSRALEDVAALLIAYICAAGNTRHDTADQHDQTPARVTSAPKRNQGGDLLRRHLRQEQST